MASNDAEPDGEPIRLTVKVIRSILTPSGTDFLHNPDPRRDIKNDQTGTILTFRGIANLGFLFLLSLGLLTLLYVRCRANELAIR